MDDSRLSAYRDILAALSHPAFLLDGNLILCKNAAADALPEAAVSALPQDPEFLDAGGVRYALSVRALEGCRLVLCEPVTEPAGVAAARAIRTPLSSLFSVSSSLLPYLEEQENPRIQQQTAEWSRSLYRLLRAVSNLEAAAASLPAPRKRREELCALLSEFVKKAEPLCESAGFPLLVRMPDSPLPAFLDRELLARALLNLLSNALRFSAPGGSIRLQLEKRGQFAVFCVVNDAEGEVSDDSELPSGTPSLDPRSGAGLGLGIVREIAQAHGGTLLLERSADLFTADFSLSLALPPAAELRSPCLSFDYAGGFDHFLMELSDALPPSVFSSLNID